MPKIRILSIDGGGIRGIIPGTILAEVEARIQAKMGKDARLADHVDLVAGTSTGGIITCGMLLPGAHGRARYSMQEVVNLYHERGADIFNRSAMHKLRTLGGIADEKYQADGLEQALEDKFGDIRLNELLRPCIITAYDIERRETVFFGQHKAATDPARNYLVRRVARATSAAPTYFEAALTASITGAARPLIDGGVFANNPAMCAYAEARSLAALGHPTSKDMFMLSIGTGSVKQSYPYKEAKDYGQLEWVKPVIDIMMSGNSETVHYQLTKLFGAQGNDDGYVRMEPALLPKATSDMDDVSPKNLRDLKKAARNYIDANSALIDRVVNELTN
jgi:patatin-like phospholipase/acyl hydrolase